MIALKSSFKSSKKIGIYVIVVHTNNKQKNQINIFVFGRAMAKETGKGDDITFFKFNFRHFNCHT